MVVILPRTDKKCQPIATRTNLVVSNNDNNDKDKDASIVLRVGDQWFRSRPSLTNQLLSSGFLSQFYLSQLNLETDQSQGQVCMWCIGLMQTQRTLHLERESNHTPVPSWWWVVFVQTQPPTLLYPPGGG